MSTVAVKGKLAVKGKFTAAEAAPVVVITDDHGDFARTSATLFDRRDIRSGETISGKITIKTSQFGNILVDRDVDVFRFLADEDDMYNGVLRVDTPNKMLKMKVFDETGTMLGEYETTVAITLAFSTPEAKEYFIAIYGASPDDEIDYKMKIVKVVDR